jgi:hypothetical protein
MTTIRVTVREALNDYRQDAILSGVDINLLKFWKDNDTAEFRTETVAIETQDKDYA